MAEIAASLGMQPRVPTGEKGIGRLAIAAIGPQVLLVTRARRSDGLYPTVASFVNWSLFELPGISLDEIEVPVREFPDGQLPNSEDVSSLVDSVRANLEQLRRRIDDEDVARIARQLDQASLDVAALQRRLPIPHRSPKLTTGTQFYIQPTDPMLAIALDAEPEKRRIGDLQKILTGFTNTMMPDRPDPVIAADFRDHRSVDFSESVIGPEAFFTPEEFLEADHHIEGTFDEYGQFTGTVAVYGRDPEHHAIAWSEARGQQTFCGPFSINFAHIQGAARESSMTRERWGMMSEKLDRMGGLYIYRNGIRILPYGNADNDFLRIEERRTLGAAYYFFSARKMFGAIELPLESFQIGSSKKPAARAFAKTEPTVSSVRFSSTSLYSWLRTTFGTTRHSETTVNLRRTSTLEPKLSSYKPAQSRDRRPGAGEYPRGLRVEAKRK